MPWVFPDTSTRQRREGKFPLVTIGKSPPSIPCLDAESISHTVRGLLLPSQSYARLPRKMLQPKAAFKAGLTNQKGSTDSTDFRQLFNTRAKQEGKKENQNPNQNKKKRPEQHLPEIHPDLPELSVNPSRRVQGRAAHRASLHTLLPKRSCFHAANFPYYGRGKPAQAPPLHQALFHVALKPLYFPVPLEGQRAGLVEGMLPALAWAEDRGLHAPGVVPAGRGAQ